MSIYQSTPPPCPVCGNDVNWAPNLKKWRTYCSRKCSTSVSLVKAREAAKSDEAKNNRKQTMLDRYGVANASHIPDVKENLSQIRKDWWEDKNPRDARYEFDTETLDYRQYEHRVQYITDCIYQEHKATLDPEGLRGKGYHIDHIYSKYDGFHNQVPPKMLCHPSNLQLLPESVNVRKHIRSDKTLDELYADQSL